MKKLFILFTMLLVLGASAFSQAGYQQLANDSTKGAQTKYATSTVSAAYNGFITFDFTVVNRQADTMLVVLQGSNDGGTTYLDIDTAIHKVTTTATNYQLSDYPCKFLKYRLKKIGSVNDTSYFSKQLFIYKR
jgi:hypothetical protein